MANPRSTDTKIPRVTRQATAAPVNTFVQPDKSASQLAEALGEFNPKLMRFSQEWATRANAESQQAGIALAQKMAEQGQLAGSLTRDGSLAMQDNAWFRAGLEEEEGRLAAGKWRSEFVGSDEFKAVQESTNLADFDAAAAKFNGRFSNGLGGSSSGTEFYARGFGTLQSNYQSAARYAFAMGIEGKLGAQSDAVLFGRTVTIVTEDQEKGVDPAVTIAAINKLQEQTIARGRNETFVRRTVVDAMDEIARKQADPKDGLKLVQMWERINGEGGVAIGKSKYGISKLDKLKEDLTGEVWRKEARDMAASERQEKQLIEEGEAEYQIVLSRNGADSGRSILTNPKYASVRARLAQKLAGQVQVNDSLVFRSNEYVVRNTLAKIFNPKAGEPEVTTSFIGALGNITPADKVMLNSQLEGIKAAKGSGTWERLFKDPAINEQRKLIEAYYADPITKLVPRERQNKYGGALMAFNARVLGGLESGEYDAAKTGERLAWLGAVRAEVGALDPTIMNSQDIQGVGSYLLDPNQPGLGRVPTGQPAGRLGDLGQPNGAAEQKPQDGKVPGSESGAAENPFTGMGLKLDPSVLDELVDETSPGHDDVLRLVAAMVKAANQPATAENIQFFIDAQVEAAGAAKGN